MGFTFTKMHSLGNNFLCVYGEAPPYAEELCRKLSDRHWGAGADGMLYIAPSDIADFKIRIFHADGSEAKMCENGILCAGRYVYDKGYTDKTRLQIETLSGVRELELRVVSGKAKAVTVRMGPVSVGEETHLEAAGIKIACLPVFMETPHAVVFVEDVGTVPLAVLGSRIQRSGAFPEDIHVEFVQPLSSQELRMRAWKQGGGVTACGTGACACAAAAVRRGLCGCDTHITIRADGGTLNAEITADCMAFLTGPAEIIYEGETELC